MKKVVTIKWTKDALGNSQTLSPIKAIHIHSQRIYIFGSKKTPSVGGISVK